MKVLAKENSHSATLMGTLHYVSNVPELTGEYCNKKDFEAACYRYNRNIFHLKAIEVIGVLQKWALYDYFGQWSKHVGDYARQCSREFQNFFANAPEKQAEACSYLIHVCKHLLPKLARDKQGYIQENKALFEAYFDKYLEKHTPYNNPELCK